MQNVYQEKLKALPHEIRSQIFLDEETEKYQGCWRSCFQRKQTDQQPLYVEIGCNAGHVITKWAKQHPNKMYIGIDWKFKAIYKAVQKIDFNSFKNILFFRSNAEKLPFIFGPQEIDAFYLLFPDPWPKRSHWKNRFITAHRLNQLVHLIKPEGFLHIRTDHASYFEWIKSAIEESQSWTVIESSSDLYKNHPSPQKLEIPDVTLFEKIYIRKGLPIFSIKLTPKKKLTIEV